MSRKRKSPRKKQNRINNRQLVTRSNGTRRKITQPTGLRDDEIGLLIDPKNPSQALSYITPDGTVIEPGQNDPRGVPSIIHPDLFVTHSQT